MVIGSGLGGLSAACLLASKGHNVTVLEKNSKPGGKINEIRAQGYRFDTGPSLLTMPLVLKSLFEQCGSAMDDHLTVEAIDPICRYFFATDTRFDCYRDEGINIAQIQAFAPDDVQAYREFMDYSRDLYQRTKEAFLFNPLYGLSDVSSLKLTDFFRIDAFKTVAERVDRQFTSPELQKFFKRFTTYNGSSPYRAPATLNVIPHVEIGMGGYYIKGGMYRLIEALVDVARRLGVTFSMNRDVKKITVKDRRVTGVADESGHFNQADLVVSNADACETYLNLMDASSVSSFKQKKLSHTEPSCSGFVLMLGIDRTYPQLSHHTIFFSGDYRREFTQIFEHQMMPDDPTIYVANTSHSDPGHAPGGGSNLFVLVNAPYLTENSRWDERSSEYRDVLIRKLEQRGLDGLTDHIRYTKTITPADFHQKYRSNRGSIYGTSSNSRLSAFLRPRNKSRSIEGLYLVGGSTHPGGGIPLVILSAFHATELISRYREA
ncbi:phytoene desaturase [Fodinibius roseus]|uniref:Phytoene desaturase n=1 Tax=Fodinibius roseus TaxID=1194090 RepID=A0A1M5F3S6_9BACT|nr:phytoene desaturase family protein [Fodinibius roseus]SHF86189.1 phytoene desaturase [Fodinibius roseus]